MYFYKREAKRDFTYTYTVTHTYMTRRRQSDHGGKDWSDVATSQRMPEARSWKRQGMGPSLENPECTGSMTPPTP